MTGARALPAGLRFCCPRLVSLAIRACFVVIRLEFRALQDLKASRFDWAAVLVNDRDTEE
jgi:hypothetical protein